MPEAGLWTGLDAVLEQKYCLRDMCQHARMNNTLMQIISTPHAVEMNMLAILKVFVAGLNET